MMNNSEKPSEKCSVPEISVLIPAFDTAKYLRETLDSVYGQTWFMKHRFEVLIGVDRCDSTLEELIRISPRYPGLRIIEMKENGGPFKIRNTLIKLARADTLSFFDSDDIMLPDLIERAVAMLDTGNCDAVQYRVLSFHDGKLLDSAVPSDWCNEGSMVMRRYCFDRTGGYKAWRCAADTEFRNRLASCCRLVQLEDPGYYYRRRAAALTSARGTGFGSDIRKQYKAEIMKGFDTPFVEPVTGEYTEHEVNRIPFTLNVFTNCTGNPMWYAIMKKSMDSWNDTFGFADEVKVFMDRNPVQSAVPANIERCRHMNVTVTDSLVSGYRMSVEECSHEFAFQLEHDWVFNSSGIRHSISDLAAFMKDRGFCHLRFNKRRNEKAGWDKAFVEGSGGIPHCITDQLSNNPHILHVPAYRTRVLPMLTTGAGSKGIEEVISWKQEKGAVYGCMGEDSCVSHLDGRGCPEEVPVQACGKVTDLFANAMVINLDTDIERYTSFRNMLKGLGLSASRIRGYEDGAVPAKGCAVSHRKAIEAAFDAGMPYAVIMEDDIKPSVSRMEAAALLEEAAEFIQSGQDFDILYLGYTPYEPALKTGRNMYKVGDGWGAYAYILNRTMFRAVMDALPCERDTMNNTKLSDQVLKSVPVKRFCIPVFTVRPVYSHIRGVVRTTVETEIMNMRRRYFR